MIAESRACPGCRRPVFYGTSAKTSDTAPRWRNAYELRRRPHRCQASRVDDELGGVRTCAGCHEEWPLDDEFYPRVTPGGFFRSRCRACGGSGP